MTYDVVVYVPSASLRRGMRVLAAPPFPVVGLANVRRVASMNAETWRSAMLHGETTFVVVAFACMLRPSLAIEFSKEWSSPGTEYAGACLRQMLDMFRPISAEKGTDQ